MTFTKYIALMLLGFALFVGYQAYAKHERCAGLRQAAEDDNLTVPEWHAVQTKYLEACSPNKD
jgi:hypothetical protein